MIRWIKQLSCTLMVGLLLVGHTAAYAHEALDLERSDCALTVVMQYDGKPVSGGRLTLYRVGDITESNGHYGFELRPELHCNADMGQAQSEAVVNEICGCVKRQKLSGITADIDAEGVAAYGNLAVGLYLVKQSAAASGFNSAKPFLLSIPRWDGDRYSYAITAAPKTELHKLPAQTDAPNPHSDAELPQTGQLNWPAPALLALGGTLLLAGLGMRRKSNA